MATITAVLLVAHAAYWFLGAWHLPHPLSFGMGGLVLITAIGVWRDQAWARASAAAFAICVPSVWIAYVAGGLGHGWLRTMPGVVISATIVLHAAAMVPTALAVGVSLLAWRRRPPPASSGLGQQAIGSSSRQLSRIFIACAAIAEIWTYIAFRSAPPGRSSGIGLVFGTAESVVPVLVAAFACAVYGYVRTPHPRGAVRLAELVILLIVGAGLVTPIVFLLRTTFPGRAV